MLNHYIRKRFIITNYDSRQKLLAMVLGACIAALWISLVFKPHQTNFEQAEALGTATTSFFSRMGDYPIHCRDSRDLAECLAGVRARHAVSSVLWLGNSQLHAVNQWQAGQTNAAPFLFDKLKPIGLDLVTFSQPNANLQEHYVLFEYLQRQLPIKLLILPVVFDDTRESGIRKEISCLMDDSGTASAISATEIGKRMLRERAGVTKSESDTAGIAHTLQEQAEQNLNQWLDSHSALWASRPEIRGQLMISLYNLRNMLLGIKPTSKRKLIRSRYKDNMDAMEGILETAASRGITALIYVVPLRNDVEVPYNDNEYQQFKSEAQAIAVRHGARYADLDNLIPASLWGSKDATSSGSKEELDFMHFQAAGHRILAERLAGLVTEMWSQRETHP